MTTEERIAALLEAGRTHAQIKTALADSTELRPAELGRLICRMAAAYVREQAERPAPAPRPEPRPPIAIHARRTDTRYAGTAIPRAFVDRWLHRLAASEIKCYLYIARRTWGFHKHENAISLRQFSEGIRTADDRALDTGTGLSPAQVKRALAALEAHGLIIRTRRYSDRHGDQATLYALAPFPEACEQDAPAAEAGSPVSEGAAHP